jgi:hypothetical protein
MTATLAQDPMIRFAKANASYNYCGVCGHIPQSGDEPTVPRCAGGTLTTLEDRHPLWCAEEVLDRKPSPRTTPSPPEHQRRL